MTAPTWRAFGATVVPFLVCCLGAHGLDARAEHDDSVDFSAYRSYRWVEGTQAGVAFVQERIEHSVRSQLESKGLSEQAEAPDLWVVTHTSQEGRLQVDPQKYGYGYRWRSWGPTSVNFRAVDAGTLVVDLIDAESQELVWRGIATNTIVPKAKKNEKNEKQILKAAEKLFQGFPPQQ